jgi:hypothetical protein
MVIRNSPDRYMKMMTKKRMKMTKTFPPTPPPSSPVLTSQQSQASKYCELDKFTKQWSGKIIRFKEPVLGKKEEPSKKEEPMRLKSRVLHDNKSK